MTRFCIALKPVTEYNYVAGRDNFGSHSGHFYYEYVNNNYVYS